MPRKRFSNLIMIGDLIEEVTQQNPHLDMRDDCATWAIFLTARESGRSFSYPEIAEEIIALKQINRMKYDHYPSDWYDHHGSVPEDLMHEILEDYFSIDFIKMIATGKYYLGKLARAFRDIPIALVGTPQHITFISKGKVYDSWDSTRSYVMEIRVRKEDALLALPILRQLELENPVDFLISSRDCSDFELSVATEVQSQIKQDSLYKDILWGLTQLECFTSINTLRCLVTQENLDAPDFIWTREVEKRFLEILQDLRSKDVLKMLDSRQNFDPFILRTRISIPVLSNLKFD